jgi:cbb3-type cytochrome oxidase subunit 3
MPEIDRSLQLRAFLNEWATVLIVMLLIASAGVGWWAYQINLEPNVETEQRLTEQWSESTAFSHSAPITNDSLPFAAGERASNRPLYYTSLSKELVGSYRYGYTADSGSVNVTTDTYLLIRGGRIENNNMTETYWEISEPLAADSETVAPGETHRLNFTVDIIEVLETIGTVEQQLAASEGLVDVRVVSVSELSGNVDSDRVDTTYRSELPIVVSPSTFRVDTPATIDETHESFETVEVLAEPSPLQAYGSIVAFGLVVMLLILVAGLRYSGYTKLTDQEQELIAIKQARERFTEWITTGEFPSEREYEQTVLVDSLEGLVDVAIDTNKRVIEDEQLGVSTVLDDTYIYIYIQPDSPARDWLVSYADTTIDEFDEYEF